MVSAPGRTPTVSESDTPSQRSQLSSSKSRWRLSRSEVDLLVISTALKALLFSAYRSTDFEVHRNWLAITYSLPVSQWYYDTTSEWTLDYPPFFALFEKIMSVPAALVDPNIVNIDNLNYNAWSVTAFQRTTVVLTELILGAAILRFTRASGVTSQQRILTASLFFHPGFLIIDHVHFQYNGFMFGLLVYSIFMACEGRKLASGVFFAILLNFKHIYMYLAPAYFIWLLRAYCMSPSGAIQPKNFVTLANAVIAIFLVSLGPFILMGQLPQLLSRLFPFTRGLNHAYWAPNAWALLTAADRVLLQLIKFAKLNVSLNHMGVTSTSRGLVGDTVFAVVPNIKPSYTFIITVALQTVFLIKLWRLPSYKSFVTALTLCGYVSFMFGWHVHEKAILLVLVPLSLIATESYAHFRTFAIASVSGIFSLFPLLFTPAEAGIELLYTLLWGIALIPIHRQLYQFPTSAPKVILEVVENAYLMGFVFLQVFVSLIPILTRGPSLEFLPLMITSIYCAIGQVLAFLRLSTLYLQQVA